MAEIEIRRNRACLRGLHYELRSGGVALNPELVCAQVLANAERGLVQAVETWGQRRVWRLIYQFRYELRAGVKPDCVEVLHRQCVSPEQRKVDRLWLARQLSAVLVRQGALLEDEVAE